MNMIAPVVSAGDSEVRSLIAKLRHSISMAQGELNASLARKVKLEKDVGEAKWRELKKPDVEKFLEELLEAAHLRRLGTFERLLTALVTEVMPGESPISLDLSIKRNQPWLDIMSNLGGDEREDIFEDQGGALTNVIVLGLRLIAVAKAKARRIVFLDESDCWVENHRVQSFYSVLADAARKIGFQCFAISHHDMSVFEKKSGGNTDGVAVARLTGHPKAEGGAHIINGPKYRWGDDEPGIRYIKLKNVQGFHNETIYLSPGISALTGPNNHGKSTIIRLMRAIFFGEGRDGLITKGAAECVAEVGFEQNMTLRWSRNPKRKPNIEVWQLIASDGTSVVKNGVVYDTGGSEVPAWVREVTGIGPIEGHEPQIIKQKSPIFLLDKPGSVRASVLSIGQETSHIQSMIKLQKETSTADRKLIREGEAEMHDVLRRISTLEQVSALSSQLDDAERFGTEIEQHADGIKQAEVLVNKIRRLRAQAGDLQARKNVLQKLPDPGQLEALIEQMRVSEKRSDIVTALNKLRDQHQRVQRTLTILSALPDREPAIKSTDTMSAMATSLRQKRVRRVKLQKGLALLERLPVAVPVVKDTKDWSRTHDRLKDLRHKRSETNEKLRCTESDLANVDEQIKKTVEEMGNACPLCGGAVTDHHVFTAHRHGA
jgi:chorismate mutase